MNAYCTYFDSGFLLQGLAMWRSLAAHDPEAVLWVLALDDRAADALLRLSDPRLHVVPLGQLEAADPELTAVRPTRSRAEYYFTLSPCWPRWLLLANPMIARVTYLDADLLIFDSPAPIYAALKASGASALITAHRFPAWLGHYEQHGRFNVGVEVFVNDAAGRAVLEDWRKSCLEWCHDRLEGDRYADQKYLDQWPERFGPAVCVLQHPGVNLAPWNWMGSRLQVDRGGAVTVDGEPLVVFHFARFRPLRGTWWWQSGQLDYGVMPWRIRQAVYGAYWRALVEAGAELRQLGVEAGFRYRSGRLDRAFWRGLPLRLVFGSDWLRLGPSFVSGRLGLGRYSGRCLAWLRRLARAVR